MMWSRRYTDLDDIYMEYDDLVAAGDIDPTQTPVEDYVADVMALAYDRITDMQEDN